MTIKEQHEELVFMYEKYHRMLAFCDAKEFPIIRKLEEEAIKKLCDFEKEHNLP